MQEARESNKLLRFLEMKSFGSLRSRVRAKEKLVPLVGVEPTTYPLTGECSTPVPVKDAGYQLSYSGTSLFTSHLNTEGFFCKVKKHNLLWPVEIYHIICYRMRTVRSSGGVGI